MTKVDFAIEGRGEDCIERAEALRPVFAEFAELSAHKAADEMNSRIVPNATGAKRCCECGSGLQFSAVPGRPKHLPSWLKSGGSRQTANTRTT